MGEEAAVAVETDQTNDNPDPMVFSVSDDDAQPEQETKPDADAPAADPTAEIKTQVEELKKQNEELQKQLNRKFYNLRQERRNKDKDAAPEDKPKFSDAQLLKILTEHRDDPAVLMQVFKHMSEQGAESATKKAVDQTAVATKKAQAEQVIRQFAPAFFDEDSEIRMKTETMRGELLLDDHPLGDMLTLAAGMMTSMPEFERRIREDERKKALADVTEKTRVASVKNAAPANAGKGSGSVAAVGDAKFIAEGKAMGLTGGALKEYVNIRKNAAKQRQIMEA